MDIARETALKILYEISEKGAYSNIALNKYLSSSKEMRDIDRAFTTELVYGTVKWRLTLDKVISAYSKIRIDKLSPWILNILRLGAYQLMYMSKVPPSAACNESVSLARRYGHKASAGFVNAVLRNIARNGAGNILPSKDDNPAGYLSVKYSYPEWIAKKYIELFGEEFAESLLDAGNGIPDLTVRANTLKVSTDELVERLKDEGVEASHGRYVKEAVSIKGTVRIAELKAFQNGLFQVQDESSMLASIVLSPKPGETILDACSAPGGKTTHIAQIMQNRGIIIARDIHEHKLKMVREAAARLGINIIRTEVRDAAVPDPEHEKAFDKILLDVPCSGLGIVRRKPDIKWSKETQDIRGLTALQNKLLQTASTMLKPGGVLVYSTCTVLPEENEEIVKNFIKNSPDFEEDNIATYLPERLAKFAKGCMLQVYTNRDGIDGFFIARLRRKNKV